MELFNALEQRRAALDVDIVEFARGGSGAAFEILRSLLVLFPRFLRHISIEVLDVLLATVRASARAPPNSVVQCIAQVQKILGVDQYARLVDAVLAMMAGTTDGHEARNCASSEVALEIILAICSEEDPKLGAHLDVIIASLQQACNCAIARAAVAPDPSGQEQCLRLCARALRAMRSTCVAGLQMMRPALVEAVTEFALAKMGYTFVCSPAAQADESNSDSSSSSSCSSDSDSDDGWGDDDEEDDGPGIGGDDAAVAGAAAAWDEPNRAHEGSAQVREAAASLLATLVRCHANQLAFFSGRVMSSMESLGEALQFRASRSQASVIEVASCLWGLVTKESPAAHSTPGITPLVLRRQHSGKALIDRFHDLVQTVAAAILPSNRRAMIDLFVLMVPAFSAGGAVASGDTAGLASCRIMVVEVAKSLRHAPPYDHTLDLAREKTAAITLLHTLAHHAPRLLENCLREDTARTSAIVRALHSAVERDTEQVQGAAMMCAAQFPHFAGQPAVAAVFPQLLAAWAGAKKAAPKQTAWLALKHFAAGCVSERVFPMVGASGGVQGVVDAAFSCIDASLRLITKHSKYAETALGCVQQLLACILAYRGSPDAEPIGPAEFVSGRLLAARGLLEEFITRYRDRAVLGGAFAVACLRLVLQLQVGSTREGEGGVAEVAPPPAAVLHCVSLGDPALSVAVVRLAAFSVGAIPHMPPTTLEDVFVGLAQSNVVATGKLLASLKDALASIGSHVPQGPRLLSQVARRLLRLLQDHCSGSTRATTAAGGSGGGAKAADGTACSLGALLGSHKLQAELLGICAGASGDKTVAKTIFERVSDEGAAPLERAVFACALGSVGQGFPELLEPAWGTFLFRRLQAGSAAAAATGDDAPQFIVDNFSVALGRMLSHNVAAFKVLLNESGGGGGAATAAATLGTARAAGLDWQVSLLAEFMANASESDVEANADYFTRRLQRLVDIHDDTQLRKTAQALSQIVSVAPVAMHAHLNVSAKPPASLAGPERCAVAPDEVAAMVVAMGADRYALVERPTAATAVTGSGGSGAAAGGKAGAETRLERVFVRCCHQVLRSLMCECAGEPLLNLKLYSFAVEALTITLGAHPALFATTLLPLLRPHPGAATATAIATGAEAAAGAWFDLWPTLRRLLVPDHTWQSTVVIGKMKKKKDLGEPLRVAVWNFLAAVVGQFPQLISTAQLLPYAAWGLKDDQMDVRVAAADFVLRVVRLNPLVVDAEAALEVTMTEKTERKTSRVSDSLLGRLVKLILRNRTEERGDARERKACERVAGIAFALSQRAALRSHEKFMAAVEYIKAGVPPAKGSGNPALLKRYWEQNRLQLQ